MGINVVGVSSALTAGATVADVGNSLKGGLSSPPGLPADNILSSYASYDYVLTLSSLTAADFNFPDTSYKAGKITSIICKTAGADPDNRIATGFGRQDFYINNLNLEATVGNTNNKGTNVLTVQFDVFEPYSMGLFMLSLQKAADSAGFRNWREAPFLITIDFRGMKENGVPLKVPFSSRHIPINFTTIQINANENGCRYLCNAVVANAKPLTTEFAKLKSETVIKGKTVQEVLQTGEQSLQAVVNKQLDALKKDGDVAMADKVVILFPTDEDMASLKTSQSANAQTAKTDKAYVNPQLSGASTQVFKKIGVDATTLQQAASTVNKLGAADMGFNQERKADQCTAHDDETWDPQNQIWLRGKLVPNAAEGTFKFSQENDIPTAINQVLLSSKYAETALAPNAVDNLGMRTWWRIDTQIYYIQSDDNIPKTGRWPRIAVYRVVPFKVHPSKVAAANTNVKGAKAISQMVVKRYDYLYTGKNSEVISFNIDYSIGFANAMAASNLEYTVDKVTGMKDASVDPNKKVDPKQMPDGAAEKGEAAGTQPTFWSQAATWFWGDGLGGGGQEGVNQRVAKAFNNAIRQPTDMINLEIEIVGDPFWIVNSGVGNYVAEPSLLSKDLNKDGSVNWQTSEIDIIVNFRAPVDIDQNTGMYSFRSPNHTDMSADPKGGPAVGFTGLYCINRCSSYFKDGEFRQKLHGFRRPNTERKKEEPASKSQNTGGNK